MLRVCSPDILCGSLRLRPAGRIGVVLDDDGQAHALGHDVADAHAGPVQVGARGHGVAVRGDEAGGADAHGDRLRVGLLQLQGAVDDGVQDARAVMYTTNEVTNPTPTGQKKEVFKTGMAPC